MVPLWFIAGFWAFLLIPHVRENTVLLKSIVAFGGGLLAWYGYLMGRKRNGFRISFILSKNHWIQALIQVSIYFYWGIYWDQVYKLLPLLLIQFFFAYGFDALFQWTLRKEWKASLGLFPIILSTNLFILFKEDWFYFQFLMLILGSMGKEFIRWDRQGRKCHIFNPSAFSLGVVSFILLATQSTHLTWGAEIASTLLEPQYIYLHIFLAGIIVQWFFSVTLVTLSSAITLFGMSLIYKGFTGIYYFGDTTVPIAVFLGLHLLVTDPSTSPRGKGGQLVFGVIYGALVFITYGLLEYWDQPTFYDKLLPVPILNCMVRILDSRFGFNKVVNSARLSFSRLQNFGAMAVWTLLFSALWFAGHVSSDHEGRTIQFWKKASFGDTAKARDYYLLLLRFEIENGSAEGLHEMGILYRDGRLVEKRDMFKAIENFQFAAQKGYKPAQTELSEMNHWVEQNMENLLGDLEQQNAETATYLGFLYLKGEGVEANLQEATRYFELGCQWKSKMACQILNNLVQSEVR